MKEVKKTPAKKAATKPPAAKAPAKKAVTKAPVAKAPVAKAPAKKAPAKSSLSPEERYRIIQDEAYFIAERHGFNGDSAYFWSLAEAEINQRFS